MPDRIPDYSNRGISLPLGCSDLLDVIKREEALEKANRGRESDLSLELARPSKKNLPVSMGPIEMSPQITVRELAMKLGWKPFMVIAVLIKRKVFVPNADHVLGFDLAAGIAVEHGYTVIPVD